MSLSLKHETAGAAGAADPREGVARSALAGIAGVAYTLVWVIGLAIWPSNLDVTSTGSAVIAAYAGHRGVALVQFALVEGLAALALAGVTLAVSRAAQRRGAATLSRATLVFGLGAATISLVQCALGEALVGWVAFAGDVGGSALLFDLINRLDGVKMLALAGLALVGVGVSRRGALPRWLSYVSAGLALALVASGVGYLLLTSPLSLAAAVSLPLLLLWVTGSGVALAVRGRRGHVAAGQVAR